MRIISLLPSATEIVCELGLGESHPTAKLEILLLKAKRGPLSWVVVNNLPGNTTLADLMLSVVTLTQWIVNTHDRPSARVFGGWLAELAEATSGAFAGNPSVEKLQEFLLVAARLSQRPGISGVVRSDEADAS
jgi:hypothetical protein